MVQKQLIMYVFCAAEMYPQAHDCVYVCVYGRESKQFIDSIYGDHKRVFMKRSVHVTLGFEAQHMCMFVKCQILPKRCYLCGY